MASQLGMTFPSPLATESSPTWLLDSFLLKDIGQNSYTQLPGQFQFIFFNVYLFLRERERERERQSISGGGAERETQYLKQAPGSELAAQSPMPGWNP